MCVCVYVCILLGTNILWNRQKFTVPFAIFRCCFVTDCFLCKSMAWQMAKTLWYLDYICRHIYSALISFQVVKFHSVSIPALLAVILRVTKASLGIQCCPWLFTKWEYDLMSCLWTSASLDDSIFRYSTHFAWGFAQKMFTVYEMTCRAVKISWLTDGRNFLNKYVFFLFY